MSNIPPELQKLWAERERAEKTALGKTDSVLMEFRDDEPFLEGDVEYALNEKSPRHDQPTTALIEPIRDVKIFPTYKIGPQAVDLATFHVKRERK